MVVMVERKPKIEAYMNDYGLDSPDKSRNYELFLKDNVFSVEPTYYTVPRWHEVETDGPIMRVAKLSPELAKPNPVVAECIINSTSVFVWDDQYWVIAKNKNGIPHSKYFVYDEKAKRHIEMSYMGAFQTSRPQGSGQPNFERLIVIYEIRSEE